tara:strand:- start:252 stop:1703 length:1452 start_codon:yes stop_codon:yes gene_type:complete
MTQTIIKIPPVSGGSFDPTDITLTDNTSGAFLIKEGSNEYMRIDTTDTQEKTIFTTQSGANTGFFVKVPTVGDVLTIKRGGNPATFCLVNMGTLAFQVDSNKILNDLVSDARIFKVDGSNVAPLVITGDSNTTFTLDESAGALFKVQDSAGTPNPYININTTSSSEQTDIKAGSTQGISIFGNNRITLNTGTADSGSDVRVTNSDGTQLFQIKGNHDTEIRPGTFRLRSASTNSIYLETDSNTNFTHTLAASSSSTFEVKDASSATTYNQFFKAEEGVGTLITPGDGSSIQIATNSTDANIHSRLLLHLNQGSFLNQYQLSKHYVGNRSITTSAATSSELYDARLPRTSGSGHILTTINSSFSGTHAFTAKFKNSLSQFAGNQVWALTSQILRFRNLNTSNGATLAFGVETGGTVTFINNSGITAGITNPISGTQAMAAKGSASAGTYSQFVYRYTQYNTGEGSASLHDDDRYIIELLFAELI